MNLDQIDGLLGYLELPIPDTITDARAHLAKVRAMVDPGLLAEIQGLVDARVAKGEPLDLAWSAARSSVRNEAELRHERAIGGSIPRLLQLKRVATVTLFEQVRELGDVPQDLRQAMKAGSAGVEKFDRWEALALRYGKLFRLHRLLLDGNDSGGKQPVDPTAWALFGDTQHWPSLDGGRWPKRAFGPHDESYAEALPVRLRFLVDHAEFWQPDAEQCTNFYIEWSPKAGESTSRLSAVRA